MALQVVGFNYAVNIARIAAMDAGVADCSKHALRRFIIMEADTTLSPWSKICISHADCILLVGTPDTSPEVMLPLLLKLVQAQLNTTCAWTCSMLTIAWTCSMLTIAIGGREAALRRA